MARNRKMRRLVASITDPRNSLSKPKNAIFATVLGIVIVCAAGVFAQSGFITDTQVQAVVDAQKQTVPSAALDRLSRGVKQAARMWRENDGAAAEFASFCKDNFIYDPVLLQQTADRLESALETIDGHMGEMGRELGWRLDVETGPILPIDEVIDRFSPYAHVSEDMFTTKIAFIVLLNFPVYSLQERLQLGPSWTRDQWAQVRLASRFSDRVPPEVSQVVREAYQAAGNYIRDYNIWMHHLLDEKGKRLFPEGLRLITHWNLRDELKALYAEPDGLTRQEMIYDVMGRIIRQQVPKAVINNPTVDWKLSANEVMVSPAVDGPAPSGWTSPGLAGTPVDNSPEPDTRYEKLLGVFRAQRGVDKYYPDVPTLMDRRFERDREIPEAEVERMLVSLLSSDLLPATAHLIEKRLGRPLQPFDIWYDGFKPRSGISEDKLDSMVRAKYPTVQAFQAGLPAILTELGFDQATAQYLASKIEVDPSRGAGHASGPACRSDNAHLRTRIGASGMDYKGYNIAIHEFGHNVEQVFSTCKIDHTLLSGVPNTAFTEGFAFVFQSRDLKLLGIPDTNPDAPYLSALDDFWGTCEIAAVSLVDMRVWHWMYDHPDATAAQLKDAVIAVAKQVWNDYYARAIGVNDADILAIYSHMIEGALYLPDYTIGSLIAFQVEEYLRSCNLGTEMERMCLLGSITPNLWMQKAVGGDISEEPMLSAARRALAMLSQR